MNRLGPITRSIVEASDGGDRPSAGDRARVRARLHRQLAIGTAAGVGITAAAKTSSAMATAKAVLPWGLAGLLAPAAVVAATHVVMPPAPVAPHPPAATAAAVVVARARAVAPARARGAAQPAEPEAAAPRAIEETASPAMAPSPPAPPPPAPAIAPRAAQPAPAVAPVAPAPATDPLVLENQRLREVHEALQRGDADGALSLLDRARDGGQELREERAASRVYALCLQGDTNQARIAIAEFLRAYPSSSLHAHRVRNACASR